MTSYAQPLHTDVAGKATSAKYGDPGDGSAEWFLIVRDPKLVALALAEDAAHASGDLGIMALAVRNDARTTRAGATGDYSPAAVGPAGEAFAAMVPEANSAWALTPAQSTALASSLIIKAAAGKLMRLTITNTKASAQFVQLHNTTTVPADASVPVHVRYVPANSTVDIDYAPYGRYFSTGITICNSSTAATKTIGSADCWFEALYL